jgi:myo-inositol-1(or 4)-monophosphatase
MYKKELEFAKQLAQEAGEIMRRYFLSEDSEVTLKGDKTLVTLADTTINSLVIEKVKAAFPRHSVWGEEGVFHVENPEGTWVCDPVDGTMPFAKGLPISTFSLAFVDKDGNPVVGVALDPYNNRLFWAVKGQGAYMNDKKLTVSTHDTLDMAYIDQELWVNEQEGVSFDDPKDIFNKLGAKITVQCSFVIIGCLVAGSQYDAALFGQSKPEDIAAVYVIVTEAGGKVTDLLGREQRYDRPIYGAVVSNGKIHDDLVKVMSNINYISKNVQR